MDRLFIFLMALYFRTRYFRQAAWGLIVVAAVALALAVIFRPGRVVTLPAGWERGFALSTYNVVAQNVQVASRGNYVAAIYEGQEGGARSIFVALSFNGGGAFTAPVRVARVVTRVNAHPFVAISPGGQVCAMWQAFVEEENTDRIFVARSIDMGASWSAPERLQLGYEMEMLPRIYYDDRGILHLFYHAGTDRAISLYHADSADGVSFTTTATLVRLTSAMRGAFFPSIHLAGSGFYLVWQGKEDDFTDVLFLITSSNFGRSWSGRTRISRGPGNSESPSVTLHEGVLYLAYQNNADKNWAIKLQRGLSSGRNWEEKPITVSTTNANCYSPQVVVTDTDILVVWYDLRDGYPQILSRKYSLRENKLLAEQPLSAARVPAKDPSLVAVGFRAIVLWEERGMIMAKLADVYAEPPVVFSPTHPPGAWSRAATADIRWNAPRDESGITGFAAMVNDLPDFNPTIANEKPASTGKMLTDLPEGISYFHIRTVDGAGNMSRTIHYKLQVASAPPPIPVVVSSTHPQGAVSQETKARFEWSLENTDRIKGFLYTLSKDTLRRPETFTTEFSKIFDDLAQGNWFLTVVAVDRANQTSRMAAYDFIVGQGRAIDADYLKRLADDERRSQRPIFISVPAVRISFPFAVDRPFGRSAFDALVSVLNIDSRTVEGYAVSVERRAGVVPNQVNLRSNVLRVKDLADGEYYVTIRCRYAVIEDGVRRVRWTAPSTTRIAIRIVEERWPFERYGAAVVRKLTGRALPAAVVMFGLVAVMAFVGYGSRISFYSRLWRFRVRRFFF